MSAFEAAAFLFFLLYSAPHQVHHFFDQFPNEHHHDTNHGPSHGDRDNRSSTDTNCAFQASASRCHLGMAWQIAPASLLIWVQTLPIVHTADSGFHFLPAAFHIRAPPLA
ncbi:MAG TPA: hypothetical protein VH985_08745 [Candidatus Binatia bacterium]|jgi:hypothetical protein